MSRTFSEIVDEVAQMAGYQSNLPLVVSFVNRALQELTPIRHFSDLVEDRINCKFNGVYKWNMPCNFRVARAIRADGRFHYKRKKPGLAQTLYRGSYFYYESGQKLILRGHAEKYIDIAYYRATPSMLYYPLENRLLRTARTEGNYLFEYRVPQTNEWIAFNNSDHEHLASSERHSNWLTKNYGAQLTNGALSHAYNASGDNDRGARLFQIFRKDIEDIKRAHADLNEGEQ